MKTNKLLLFVSLVIVLTVSAFTNKDVQTPPKKFVVVLDAGHGGKDPGNLGNGYREKSIALKIVLAVGEALEKNPDIKVIYTRKKDVFVTLKGRAAIANKADADLFVSVHCDSHTSQAYGTSAFVMSIKKIPQNLSIAQKENEVIFLEDNYKEEYAGFNPNNPESLIGLNIIQEEYLDQSILAASLIQKNVVNNLKRKDRKVKQDVFWVLHNTYMPSVLVETGYLTNTKEGAYLNSKKGQTEMAREITKGILEYKKAIDFNIGDEVFIENDITIEKEAITNNIIYKVQIAASSKDIALKPYNFKGLDAITKIKEGHLYKYFYGKNSNYEEAKTLEEFARKKGYNASFVVAFKNGKKIPLLSAIKSKAN